MALKGIGVMLYALLCAVTAALAVYGVVHLYYMRAPVSEPVSWSCPAEWAVMPGDTLWRIAFPAAVRTQRTAMVRAVVSGSRDPH